MSMTSCEFVSPVSPLSSLAVSAAFTVARWASNQSAGVEQKTQQSSTLPLCLHSRRQLTRPSTSISRQAGKRSPKLVVTTRIDSTPSTGSSG